MVQKRPCLLGPSQIGSLFVEKHPIIRTLDSRTFIIQYKSGLKSDSPNNEDIIVKMKQGWSSQKQTTPLTKADVSPSIAQNQSPWKRATIKIRCSGDNFGNSCSFTIVGPTFGLAMRSEKGQGAG